MGCVLFFSVGPRGDQPPEILQRPDLLREHVERILCNAHLLHQLVNRLDAHFLCAFQAQPFLCRIAVLVDPGNKHNSGVFPAACTNWDVHGVFLLLIVVVP